MSTDAAGPSDSALSFPQALVVAVFGILAFHLAYLNRWTAFLMAWFLLCLVALTAVRTARLAFYGGLTIGMLIYAPQLYCFYVIFNAAAVLLWLVLAFWIGLFLLLAWLCRRNFGRVRAAVLIPFVWTGLEYFRSELYYLRFSWLSVGYTFSENVPLVPFRIMGVYGVGFLLMALASAVSVLPWRKSMRAGALLLLALFVLTNFPSKPRQRSIASTGRVVVAGVQMEFPVEGEVTFALDRLRKQHPDAELLVLSEYTLDGPVPESLKEWCRQQQRHLVVGGKDPTPDGNFYDTAFVIGPTGDILFKQAKSVPIQFFKDGLPAHEQRLWDSPWGKLGICICYDLSYVRVTDELIRLGAQGLVVPTMDVVHWGRHEHELHARVGRVRAAEYGVPIMRVASSGLSQLIDATGRELATAGFPGHEAMLAAEIDLAGKGCVPPDRWLAIVAVAVTALVMAWICVDEVRLKIQEREAPSSQAG
ncbi:MAG TPA: nitrilase-related carbon-nitrogen hydrolase [Verrucomicrobiae bacterium]